MKSTFVALLAILMAATVSMQGFARSGGMRVCHLGVAPLMGSCWTIESLTQMSIQNRELLKAAVRQAGNQEMADKVVSALCLGQVEDIMLPGNTPLETMAWYGVSTSGINGLHTIWNPVLAFSQPVPCWRFRVTVSQKTVVWIIPKKCGNLSRLKVEWRVETVIRIPPTRFIPPEEPQNVYFAEGTPPSKIEKGGEAYLGSTSSSASFAVIPGTNMQITQNGGGAVSKSSSASSSSSASNAQNQNNIHNTNLNNNSAISQSQNVVPVNVVVNAAPNGTASGSATGSGNQNGAANQMNH